MPRIKAHAAEELAAQAGVSADAAAKVLAYLSLIETGPGESDLTYGGLVRRSVDAMRQHRASCRTSIAGESVPPAFPAHVQIQTIGGCNAACVMCAMSSPEIRRLQRGRMERELFERIVSECADADECVEIALYLQNEPLLDDELADKVRFVKDRSNGRIAVRIVTNGSLLTADCSERLIAAGLDAISVSLNAHTAATYTEVMGGLSFETTSRNIEELLARAPAPLLVTLTFMVTSVNRHEIEDALGYWSGRGVLCGAYAINTQAGAVADFDRLNVAESRAAKECFMPIESSSILSNGDVLLCCTDWRRESVAGSLRTQSLRQVWHGPALAGTRRDAIDGTLSHRICEQCLGQSRLPENLMFEDADSRHG